MTSGGLSISAMGADASNAIPNRLALALKRPDLNPFSALVSAPLLAPCLC